MRPRIPDGGQAGRKKKLLRGPYQSLSNGPELGIGIPVRKAVLPEVFDDDVKQDVTDIVRKVIDVYDRRLADMEWMTETTRSEARKETGRHHGEGGVS